MRVKGVGKVPADLCFVGEGPGYYEDREGKPFVGRTGDELDRYLDGVSLPTRREVFLTNIFREYQGKDYKWTAEDLARDEPELIRELQRVLPHTIVTLGRYATRWFLGDVDMDATEGIPWFLPATCEKYPCPPEGVVVFPIIHPAAGMHNPEMSPYVVSGFKALASYLRGELQPRALFDDPYPETHYEEITTEDRLGEVLRGFRQAKSMGGTDRPALSIDTEGWPGNPWSLQFCYQPGKAYLIRATAGELLGRFGAYLRRCRPRLIFHSALHDIGMLRALGVDIGGEGAGLLDFDDTMVMAYLLQLEPQGLKAACLRHCNMKMMSYEDVIGDTANDLARDYLTWIWDSEQVEYEEKQQAEFDRRKVEVWTDARGKTRVGRKITKLPELPKTPLHKAVSRVMQSSRPKGLWEDQIEDIQVAAYHRLGDMPRATLDYVDPAVAVNYAARDADGTLRLYHALLPRLKSMGLA